MRKIFGIGETVLDIIFKGGQPQAAKPGGSMLNGLVSLGRAGLPGIFISEYALDDVGNLVDDFLKGNGVDTHLVHRFRDGKTVLAMAFLDEKNDAHYTFYRDFPKERLNIRMPEIGRDDIVMCGSFFAITSEIRAKFIEFMQWAGKNGALVVYDPNFRKSHLPELEKLRPYILENMQMADIVRGSDEDFKTIFGTENADQTYAEVSKYCTCLVYTANSEGVFVRTPSVSKHYPVQALKPVSTIGAGDNFNAGMVASIYRGNFMKNQLESLNESDWSGIVAMAVSFAADVCMSYENYISPEFALNFMGTTA
jgi:fructokinase